jgi:hypothetical protein
MQPHRVLFIPELLGIILSFVDEDDYVSIACVCKQWSEITLDVIWREVDDLSRLLSLLRPYKIRGRYNVRHPVTLTVLLLICFRFVLVIRWAARLKGLGKIPEVCQPRPHSAIRAGQ